MEEGPTEGRFLRLPSTNLGEVDETSFLERNINSQLAWKEDIYGLRDRSEVTTVNSEHSIKILSRYYQGGVRSIALEM